MNAYEISELTGNGCACYSQTPCAHAHMPKLEGNIENKVELRRSYRYLLTY